MDWDHSGGGRWLNCHILKLPANEACEWGGGGFFSILCLNWGRKYPSLSAKPAELKHLPHLSLLWSVLCEFKLRFMFYLCRRCVLCNVMFFSLLCIVQSHVFMMTLSNGNSFRVTGPLCGEFTGPGEFPTQRPVTQSFHVFFNLRLNKRLSKQPWGWWF